jgi:hypothetical protein
VVALEVIALPGEAAQRTRNVGRDGGFFGNDQLFRQDESDPGDAAQPGWWRRFD